jgi:hypothetical protein
MESLLWALDLAAVAGLCLWALRQDKSDAKTETKNDAERRR